jgi:hypothetical protein
VTRTPRFARAGAAVVAAIALTVAIPTPASALPPTEFVTEGWTYTIAPEGGNSLFQSVTPFYPDFAGTGEDVTGWPIGTLTLPGLSTLSGPALTWGSSVVSQVADAVTITTTLGGYSVSVEVTGPLAVYSITLPDRSILSGAFIYLDFEGAGADSLNAADSTSRWWFDSAGSRSVVGAFQFGPQASWVAFADVDSNHVFIFPDGPSGPTIPGGTTTVTQALVGAAPCPADRDARLTDLAAALPTAPGDAEQLAELTCDSSLGDATLVTGGSSLTPLVLPQSIVDSSWADDPSQLRASFSGLPAGVTAVLDTSGSEPAVRLSGAGALGTSVVTVRLWRDLGAGQLVEPWVGEFNVTVTAALAATGSSPADGVPVAIVLLAAGFGALALSRSARQRRAALR